MEDYFRSRLFVGPGFFRWGIFRPQVHHPPDRLAKGLDVCCGQSTELRQIHNHKEMTMNSDQMKGKWKQLKGVAKERWGKLTDDDLNIIDGQSDQLIGKIQERYGIAREAAQKQVEEWNSTAQHEDDLHDKRKAS
jgi:uncharacterized protein YjbJ (UPF0337 family)